VFLVYDRGVGTDRHAGASHPGAAAESPMSTEFGRNPTRRCVHP
jgi:hypothetical protein